MSDKQEGFGITAVDLRKYDWHTVLATASSRECSSYDMVFYDKAKGLKKDGDEKGSRVFQLLAAIAAFWPDYDNPTQPYGPIPSVNGQGTMLPSDLAKSDFEALRTILPEIVDHEFRARVGDLLWENDKDYKASQIAIEAYIESSKVLETVERWPIFVERLRRAVQLGAKLGWRKPNHEKAIAAIEAAIARHEPTDKESLCARLMELLNRDRVGDANKYSALSELKAQQAEAAEAWDLALGYWQAKKAWDMQRRNEAGVMAAGFKIAEVYRKKAEGFTKGEKPSFMTAAHWMQKSHEALQRVQADANEIQQAHKVLLDYQQKSMAEMEVIQVSADRIPGMTEKLEAASNEAAAFVGGQSFETAILRLAAISSPSDPAEMRKRVEGSTGVFSQLFGSSTVRSGGQISDTAPPLSSDDPKLREEAVMKSMYQQARMIDWPFRVKTFIEPARQKIVSEHRAQFRDLRFLVENNPFVPAGREGLFLRGLHAGLHGDLVLAMHILIPQLENSIRTIFIAKGVITSKLESDKTQDERDLGWLLTHKEMSKIFTGGMAFDLRGLLVERFGLNIRNDLSHGFLEESQMMSEGALYVWWLILRLCCIPILNAQQAVNPNPPAS